MLGTGEELDLNYSQSGKKKKTNAHELQQTADLSRDDGVRGSQWEITAPLPAAPDVPAMTQEYTWSLGAWGQQQNPMTHTSVTFFGKHLL